MEEKETKAPCRVQLVFADRYLLSKEQRSDGFRRSWVVIRPDLKTVAEFCRDITSRFGLSTTSSHGLSLLMDGIIIPSSESTTFFRDNDTIRVKGAVIKEKKKKAVATPVIVLQIEGNELINKGAIVSSNGIPLIDNGEDTTEKKKKERKRPLPEETDSKREQKEVEIPTSPKKKKLKLMVDERPVTINERRKYPAVTTPSQFHNVIQQPNTPVLASERNKQVASINKSTSTGFRGGPKGKKSIILPSSISNDQGIMNVHGAFPGNGTHQPLPSHSIPGQARFMSPGPSNWQDNRPRKPFQGDVTRTKGTSWKPKSRFNGPNAQNRNWQPRRDSSGRNAINSQLRIGNNFTTAETAEKIIPHGEEINEDKLDFESLYPLPNLPRDRPCSTKRFRVENWWLNTEGFKEAWEQGWIRSRSLTWSERMTNMRGDIGRWAASQQTPQNRIQWIQKHLYNYQLYQPSLQDPRVEEALLAEYRKAEDDLEQYWRQRSRIQWQLQGDRNTTFFHVVANQRRKANFISQVRAEDGPLVTEDSQVRKVFVEYFKKLYCPDQEAASADPTHYLEQCTDTPYPKIPMRAHSTLMAAPSEEEVKEALFRMGPDTSPGPDGMTVMFLQTYWSLFKSDLTRAIQEVFLTGQTPKDWLSSHIVLIPKIDEPTTPRDYRPITVGNVIYRLLMKIVASRLQPYMGTIISNTQTGFLKGRSTVDNTILIREVMHSFNATTYTGKTFLLKADINKAFDTLRWSFLSAAMHAVNVPDKLIQLVTYCMASSRVTVLVNGSGDGFITPNRGLRQGCPLSPYLFIMAMEFLTKQIQTSLNRGNIRGIQLARTAPTLTHVMYVDDLMIMGQATPQEAREFREILASFARSSGLVINPEKSAIWFSRACDISCRQCIVEVLGARAADDNERYLGVFITEAPMQDDLTHNLLIDKINTILAGWGMNILSYAGRVAFIKAVIMSILVYYMSVAMLLPRTTNKINAIICKYFWGKLGKDKYQSFIAWRKVCLKVEEGGLGIRDIKLFNQALLLKVVWQVAANQDRLWVHVMRAKYFPRGGFWSIKSKGGTSQLWRTIQDLKVFFKDEVRWHVGDGKAINAINQPWFEGWGLQQIVTNRQSDVTVSELFDHQLHQWKTECIRNLMGPEALQLIQDMAPKPTTQPLIQDKLIWLQSKKGVYTTKEGYDELNQRHLVAPMYTESKKSVWKKIWTWKGILPRVRIFLWRVVHDGLPTLLEQHRKIHAINPTCPRCNTENEFLMHMLFFCPASRATWYASQFTLRVDRLPLDFATTLLAITAQLDEPQIVFFCNLLWCLWKARNNEIFSAKRAMPLLIIAQARVMEVTYQSARVQQRDDEMQLILIPDGAAIILIDGSWEISKKAGIGAIIFDPRGLLINVQYRFLMAQDPLEAEAFALLNALEHIASQNGVQAGAKYAVYSDCKVLVDAVHNDCLDDLPSWRAAPMVAHCARRFQSMKEQTLLRYVRRDALKQPHLLANWARRTEHSFSGFPSDSFMKEMDIDKQLDSALFRF